MIAIDQIRAQDGRAGDVGVGIESDRLPRSRRVDVGQRLHRAAPVLRPGALVMRDDHRHVAAPRGRECLVERGEDVVHLVADVRRVDAAGVTGDAGEQGKLIDIGGGAGRVEHAGRQADRTRVHAFAQQLDHPRLLGAGRRAVRIVHRCHPQRRMADQRRDVDRGLRAPDGRNIGGHRRIDVLVIAAKQVQRRRHVGVHERREADAAIAHDDRGHPLRDLRQHPRIREHDLVVVRVDVDEAGRDDQSRDIDHLGVRGDKTGADRGDPVAVDAHIGNKPVRAGAVDDGAAGKQERGLAVAVSGIHDDLPFRSITRTEARDGSRFPCPAPSAPAARA